MNERAKMSWLPAIALGSLLATDVAAQEAPSNPWLSEKVGAWYRTRSTLEGSDTFFDTGLVEKTAEYVTVAQQIHAGGKVVSDMKNRYTLKRLALTPAGEEEISVSGTSHRCQIFETREARTWVVKSGPYKGAVLQMKSQRMAQYATRLATETLRIKDRTFECIVVDIETDAMGRKTSQRTWTSPQCPVGNVRVESAQSTHELVDFGSDWEKRPAPDLSRRGEPVPETRKDPEPPKDEPAATTPEEKAARSKKLQEDATRLLVEAIPLFKDVKAGADAPPSSRAAVDALLKKAEQCTKKLYDAQLKFTLAQRDAADAESVKKHIKQIDSLMNLLTQYKRTLGAR